MAIVSAYREARLNQLYFDRISARRSLDESATVECLRIDRVRSPRSATSRVLEDERFAAGRDGARESARTALFVAKRGVVQGLRWMGVPGQIKETIASRTACFTQAASQRSHRSVRSAFPRRCYCPPQTSTWRASNLTIVKSGSSATTFRDSRSPLHNALRRTCASPLQFHERQGSSPRAVRCRGLATCPCGTR